MSGVVGGQAEAAVHEKMADTEVIQDVQAYLEQLVVEDTFSGAVLVAHKGQPLFKQAYGLASKSFSVPNRVDTKFNLGSMNKMFTAVAIAQLAEAGKLRFNDTVGEHLPEYPNQAVAQKVTIHQLLTHTSGLGTYFNEAYISASKDRFRQIKDYLLLFVNDALAFEPGARFQYSNAGFMVLGALIERVSEENYFDYMREHLYKPAGMPNTDAYELDYDTPNLAIGYTHLDSNGQPQPGPRRNNLYRHVVKGGPAGGGFSTVEDLLSFDQALRTQTLLNPEYTQLLLKGKVDTGWGDMKYAYGFGDRQVNGTRIVGHNGGFPGISAHLAMYLDLGYTVAILSNYDPPVADQIAKRLLKQLTGVSV